MRAIQQNLFPIDLAGALVLGFCLRLLFDLCLLLVFFLLLGLDQIEERIVEQLLLQMLLQVEQGHVEKVHRLVKARIDLQLLPELGRLIKAGLQDASSSSLVRESLSRSRAASVGPR